MYLTSKKNIDVIVELIGGSEGIAKKNCFFRIKKQKTCNYCKQSFNGKIW